MTQPAVPKRPRRPALTKAIAEAIAGGMRVSRAEILPDGRIILADATSAEASPYDGWKKAREGRNEGAAPGHAKAG